MPLPEKTPDIPDTPGDAGDAAGDSCRWANDGVCDEPANCGVGTDATDCSGDPLAPGDTCEYANDGECDEPTYCLEGTDETDCSGGGGGAGGGGGGGADSCAFANDGECNEPNLCAEGTDTTDCAGGGSSGISMGASCASCAGNPICAVPTATECGSLDSGAPGWCVSSFGTQGECTQSCALESCPSGYTCLEDVAGLGGDFCYK
ncbi:MAG: hypothetical protein GY811_04760 [Myxococcales bacterium]|nr:hypothetical protein [Myxococcales bacterium]